MHPSVSLLIAMRNESGRIDKCLASILAQDYTDGKLEIWVLDGKSTDISYQIVEEIFRGKPNCRLLSNPKITQSAGWNLGISQATGDIIGIVSAHAELSLDYVSKAVETLERTGADLAGGLMRAQCEGATGQAIALATSTPFGVGGARFHYTDREEEVDTVYMGLCWRSTYRRIGGFDEEMVRNQDDELSYRLLQAGGRIVCNPAIRSTYHNRSTFRSLWRQYFQYGFWKVRVMQKHPRQMRLRQFVPAVFVSSLSTAFLLLLLFPIGKYLAIFVLGAYTIFNLVGSALLAEKTHYRYLPLISIAFAILHVAYGLGFLAGLIRFCNRWFNRKQSSLPFKTISDVDTI
jgi:succinoglycan biosynthesis protein ExoA